MSEKQKDVSVRRQKKLFSPKTGEQIGIQRRVFAEFRKGGVPDWALGLALEKFKMNGKPPEIDPRMWLCVYDSGEDQRTRGWTDEEREMIEAKLLSENDVHRIDKIKVKAPTPNYVKLTTVAGKRTIELAVAKALEFVTEQGFEASLLVEFERQEARKESEAIIAALEALGSDQEPEETELVAV